MLSVSPTQGAISGTVKAASSDGTLSPVANAYVFLDLNNNGVYDAGEPAANTNAQGQYTFSDLDPGSYNVLEILPQGNVELVTGSAGPAAPTNFAPIVDNNQTPGQGAAIGSSTPDAAGAVPLATLNTYYSVPTDSAAPASTPATAPTIAIVDAENDPNIAADLAGFDAHYGLPAPPVLTVVEQAGTPRSAAGQNSWASEEALDVDWAHAQDPTANILVVETTDAGLYAGVNFARNYPGVNVVAMSWGKVETLALEQANDAVFTTPVGHTPVTFLAASGDYGAFPSNSASPTLIYPEVSPLVVSVGGTSFTVSGSGDTTTLSNEVAWNGSGGGLSLHEPAPSYQQGIAINNGSTGISAGGKRAVPDVAWEADPKSGVAVFDTYDTHPAWTAAGGTSLSVQVWGGIIAMADQARIDAGKAPLDGGTQTLPALYQAYQTDPSAFMDIASGSNGFYAAGPGYDLVTGLGSPNVTQIIQDLVNYQPPQFDGQPYAQGPEDFSVTVTANATVQNINFVRQTIGAITAPGMPTNVQATQGTASGQVQITWAAVSGATSYDIWRSAGTTTAATLLSSSISGTSYKDTTTTVGATYYYWVRAVNSSQAGAYSAWASGYSVGALALTTPSTATSVNSGTTYQIKWTGGSSTDTVQLWAEGGPNNAWTELTTGVPQTNGSFTWNTTGVAHGWYYFQAWDTPAGGIPYAVQSPNYLHIVAPAALAPTISLTNPPLAGDSVAQGNNYTLNFTASDGNGDNNPIFVQLWVYSGNTGLWTELPNANYLPASQGHYDWNTTGMAPGWYSFAAHATNGDLWSYATSPGWLNITVPTPAIAFTTPTSGQSIAHGATFNLDWNITGLPGSDLSNSIVQIWAQHMVNGSAVWQEIAASVNAANGTYSWTVPSSPGAGTFYAFSIYMNYGDIWWAQASPNWLQVT